MLMWYAKALCVCVSVTTTTTQHPFNGPFSGTTQVSQYQNSKTNLNLLQQAIVSGNDISCHKPVLYQNGGIDQAVFGVRFSLDLFNTVFFKKAHSPLQAVDCSQFITLLYTFMCNTPGMISGALPRSICLSWDVCYISCCWSLAICRPSDCTVVFGIVVIVVVVGVCNRSQMRTSICTCLIFGVSIGLDPG